MNLKKIIFTVFKTINNHKGKIFLTVLSAMIFFIVRFPYNDLSDLLKEKVSTASNNKVFLNFSSMGLSFVPSPAVVMKEVSIETPTIPPLKADVLKMGPSVSDFLSFKWGLVISASNFLDGDLHVHFQQTKSEQEKLPAYGLSLKGQNLSARELSQLAKLPLSLVGNLNINFTGLIEPSLKEQPHLEFNVSSPKSLKLPASNVSTPFGPFPLPSINFSQASLKGRMIDGSLILEEILFGSQKDPFSLRLKGNFAVEISQRGSRMLPLPGGFEISTEIRMKAGSLPQLAPLLFFVEKFEKKKNGWSTYRFKAKAKRFGQPPKLSSLKTF